MSAGSLDAILASFAEADIVSFDVFDTLLARPLLRPTDVFPLVRDRVNAMGETALLANWPEQRVRAEHWCYQSWAVGPNVTIEQIYEEIGRAFGYPSDALDAAMRAELEIEFELLTATSRGKVLFEGARLLGKRIFIVSDMYLPPALIEKALEKQGFVGWDRLIVSGYEKIAKHDGSVFRALREEFSDEKFVHVGDNPISDVQQPREHGMGAFELERQFVLRTRAQAGSAIPFRMLQRIASAGDINSATVSRSLVGGLAELWMERQPTEINALDEIGYCIVGPMYAGFVQYVHDRAIKDGVSSLAFLARDGAIMKRSYQTYFANEALPSSYLYASRRMMNFSVISDRLTARDYDFLSATGTPIPIEAFCTRMLPEVDSSTLDEALARTGLERGTIVDPLHLAPAHKLLAALQPEIVQHAKREQKNVIDYLHFMKVDTGRVGLVDIGWQGSIQSSIESLLGVEVHGYYWGVLDTPKTSGRPTMHGWLDERRSALGREWLSALHGQGVELVELLFAHPGEASIITVTESESGFAPLHSRDRLREVDAQSISRIQESALEFVADLAVMSRSKAAGVSTSLSFDVALTFMRDLVVRPSRRQARLLGSLHHDNSLGVRSYPVGMPRRGKRHYSSHPNALARERARSWWKPGFDVNASRLGLSERPVR